MAVFSFRNKLNGILAAFFFILATFSVSSSVKNTVFKSRDHSVHDELNNTWNALQIIIATSFPRNEPQSIDRYMYFQLGKKA